jgi:DNA-binding transcriptional ArsR family regulator
MPAGRFARSRPRSRGPGARATWHALSSGGSKPRPRRSDGCHTLRQPRSGPALEARRRTTGVSCSMQKRSPAPGTLARRRKSSRSALALTECYSTNILFEMPRRSGTPSLLPLLRSRTQAELLERLILHPDVSYTVADLARHLAVTDMSVRRELERMLDAGIIEREAVGRQGIYRASTASPLF